MQVKFGRLAIGLVHGLAGTFAGATATHPAVVTPTVVVSTQNGVGSKQLIVVSGR